MTHPMTSSGANHSEAGIRQENNFAVFFCPQNNVTLLQGCIDLLKSNWPVFRHSYHHQVTRHSEGNPGVPRAWHGPEPKHYLCSYSPGSDATLKKKNLHKSKCLVSSVSPCLQIPCPLICGLLFPWSMEFLPDVFGSRDWGCQHPYGLPYFCSMNSSYFSYSVNSCFLIFFMINDARGGGFAFLIFFCLFCLHKGTF